jgi:ligand-binding sensor domain-containing protein
VGTAGDGLHTMDRTKGTFERHLYDSSHPDKLSRPPIKNGIIYVVDHITFITEDAKRRIWVGTFEGGINVYDPSTGKVSYYGADNNSKEKLGNNDFWTAFRTMDEVVWISTYTGNLYKVLPYQNVLPYTNSGTEVRSFSEDDVHTLWLGTVKGLIHKDSNGKEEQFLVDKDSSSGSNQILDIEKDDKKFWVATPHGLYVFGLVTKTFSAYYHRSGYANNLVSDTVIRIKKDLDNKLWIGTINGLDLMDTKSGTFTHFQNSLKDTASISNNFVIAISIDKKQNVWVGTLKGLNRLHKKQGVLKDTLTN